MQHLTHLPLERLRSRYTQFLRDWETEAFEAANFAIQAIAPDGDDAAIVMDIQTGRVLDRIGRPLWCLKQMQRLLQSQTKDLGKIYFSDFYTSGLDALAYSGLAHKSYAFCWAQTFDQYDFTRDMINFMRPFEFMAFSIYRKIFVACEELADLIVTAVPTLGPKYVEVVGLPFDSKHVERQINLPLAPADEFDLVYSSRWDTEKRPGFFLEFVEAVQRGHNIRVAICTGRDALYGTDMNAIRRAEQMELDGKLTIFRNCTKGQYYAILSRSKVQMNTALQDWVSYTLLEALTFGCQPLYPHFRSFPRTLMYQGDFLYVPDSLADAYQKFMELRKRTRKASIADAVLAYHDSALYKIADVISAD